ncbi:MAG: hypothetical protein BWZ07_03111 [Alphaproteobacteria bacterium ADurb.BinA280]|nr:MAG: hypothetical protein BWZ07_03111 [Alphaproteobacteria bacterium ADurb.BinA280]
MPHQRIITAIDQQITTRHFAVVPIQRTVWDPGVVLPDFDPDMGFALDAFVQDHAADEACWNANGSAHGDHQTTFAAAIAVFFSQGTQCIHRARDAVVGDAVGAKTVNSIDLAIERCDLFGQFLRLLLDERRGCLDQCCAAQAFA